MGEEGVPKQEPLPEMQDSICPICRSWLVAVMVADGPAWFCECTPTKRSKPVGKQPYNAKPKRT